MSYISPEDLKKLQYVLIEMLKEFDKICRDNNIEYFVFAGTELGAVRHKGIIPWDDDTDVGMMRSEFEKLKKVFAEQDTGNLILGSPDGNYEWHERLYPRIYYKGTPLCKIFHIGTKEYSRVIRRLQRGLTIEQAMEGV